MGGGMPWGYYQLTSMPSKHLHQHTFYHRELEALLGWGKSPFPDAGHHSMRCAKETGPTASSRPTVGRVSSALRAECARVPLDLKVLCESSPSHAVMPPKLLPSHPSLHFMSYPLTR